MADKFTHLHLHTEYSLLDGLSRIKKLMEHVKENEMNSVAITDHGAMYGAIEFYKKAKEMEVKPIIGMEGYVTNIGRKLRGERKKMQNFHLLLLAKNHEGYKNLMKLTTIAHLEGYYYRPRVDHKTLKKYSKGIICTSACMQGEVAKALIDDDYAEAKKVVDWHLDVFGDDYYLEVQRHGYEEHLANATDPEIRRDLERQQESEQKTNEGVLKLSREYGIPIVATCDAHYIKKEDARAQDALVCIATGKNVSDIKRLRYIDVPDFYVKTPKEMKDLYSDIPEVLENTVKVAEKCELEITLGQYFFPKVELPQGKTAEETLRGLAEAGLVERYKKETPELRKRLDYELKVIKDKGYPAYFLIFKDMADWAREHEIPINTRGSAAGSLVSYCLGITTVDPIRYLLPFERFLNPFRPSAPDIDMDIADDKRGEMIEHLTKKYGKDKVAQICTFGRMLPRAAVRDVARVLGHPYAVGDKISKSIPMGSQGFPMTFARALEESEELKEMYRDDKTAKEVIELAKQIEGNVRHLSVHAAGTVISPTKLTDFVPLQLDTSEGEKVITQYEMHAVDDVGLVKLDILGIRNLSILREAVQRVKERTGKTVDLRSIPVDDKKTFDMLARGETMGTFQLGGSGMTRYLVELKPESIEDIMIMIALFRPGPMMNIEEYIARKHGKKKVTYYHPKMEKFLDKSLGVLVFQDDLLYTALELAGYDWEEVDKFRKAVGKKIPEEMAKQHIKFVEGCVEHSKMTKEEAEGLWKLFEPFQGYGFNKAHAASYGMVAYQTAYMKANFPVEYMAAHLTAESHFTEKVAAAIAECKRMGIVMLPPDINVSDIGFKVVDDQESLDGKAIRFGLSAIKNVGNAAIEAILAARTKSFVSLADFCTRVDARKVNKKVVESLIKVGAMSQFGNRAALLEALDEVRGKVIKPKENINQQSLFGEKEELKASAEVQQVISQTPEFEEKELVNLEIELLGFSITGSDDMDKFTAIRHLASCSIEEIVSGMVTEPNAKIVCSVSSVREVVTKKTNAKMAFASVNDGSEEIDLVIFPKIYETTKHAWFTGNVLVVKGKLDSRDDKASILVDEIQTADEASAASDQLVISIPKKFPTESLTKLVNLLKANKGDKKAKFVFEGGSGGDMTLPFTVDWNDTLAREIQACLEVDKASSVKYQDSENGNFRST